MKVWVHMVKTNGNWEVLSDEEFIRKHRREDGYSHDLEDWIPCKVEIPDEADNVVFTLDDELCICWSRTMPDGTEKQIRLKEV